MGLGFRFWGLGFRIESFGFRVSGSGPGGSMQNESQFQTPSCALRHMKSGTCSLISQNVKNEWFSKVHSPTKLSTDCLLLLIETMS